jgi:hypothetical protein
MTSRRLDSSLLLLSAVCLWPFRPLAVMPLQLLVHNRCAIPALFTPCSTALPKMAQPQHCTTTFARHHPLPARPIADSR